MTIDDIQGRAGSAWVSFRSAAETLCLWIMVVGTLALVIHSWILLSNNNERGAVGAIVCVLIGGAGAVLYVEQWLSAGLGAVYLLGCAWGRADRSQCARMSAIQAAVAGLWWVLLTFGGPIALGFGFGVDGLEKTMRLAAFWVVLVNHVLRLPGRLRVAWQAVATPKSDVQAVTL